MTQRSIIDVKVVKDNLIIKTDNSMDNIKVIEEINKFSKKFKIKLSLINIIIPSLESLFLDLTGKKLRDSIEEEINEKEHF